MPSLLLYAVALSAVVAFAPPVTVYWDAFGYILQAINGDVGGLGLGRPVFAFATHAIAKGWLALGGSASLIEPLLRAACALVSSAAAPLTLRLAVACGLESRAGWLAGLAVACSPALAHAGGQVLTDGPAVTLLLFACILAVESSATGSAGRALASGVVLGLAIGVREQLAPSVLTLAALAWCAPRPHRPRIFWSMTVGCLTAVLAPLLIAVATHPAYLGTIEQWLVGVGLDRSAKTYSWHDLGTYLLWLAALGPATFAAAFAVVAGLRLGHRPSSAVIAIALPACVQAVSVATLRGIEYSPRLLLPVLPALALVGASPTASWSSGSRWRLTAVVGACVLPTIIAAPIVRLRSQPLVAVIRDWPHRLGTLPSRAVIVSGQPCPAVRLVQALVRYEQPGSQSAPDWRPVCPGWAWPDDLPALLDAALASDEAVAADLRTAAWVGAEQRAARAELERYVAARLRSTTEGRLVIWTE